MIIQIFGKKNCNDSKKAQRFFKERGVKFQLINLAEKGISKGELSVITKVIPLEELIDENGQEYNKRNLKYMVFNLEELLMEVPVLFKTPIVRYGKDITIGNQMEIWKNWHLK
ncbi:arsenate reductase family protein [uncultured Cetobacterium sp.]|uniref:arsenate reductase family protein n=1 Tax=uncultured Cetobacterium sp. TaxID=527638 RepID=UPI002620907F|nr:ArsC/Spx/MgsR family protein [uncultured Cetobacterium sp.]